MLRPALIEIDRSDLFFGDRPAVFSAERSPCECEDKGALHIGACRLGVLGRGRRGLAEVVVMDGREAAGIGAKNNAARDEAGGVGGMECSEFRTVGRPGPSCAGEDVVRAEVGVEASDLIAVASLEEIQDLMDEVDGSG